MKALALSCLSYACIWMWPSRQLRKSLIHFSNFSFKIFGKFLLLTLSLAAVMLNSCHWLFLTNVLGDVHREGSDSGPIKINCETKLFTKLLDSSNNNTSLGMGLLKSSKPVLSRLVATRLLVNIVMVTKLSVFVMQEKISVSNTLTTQNLSMTLGHQAL